MKEIVQAIICLWEISMPLVFAGKVAVKREMRLPVTVLWYLCEGVNVGLLVMQRHSYMYSRYYLLICIGLSALLLGWKYRVNYKSALIGLGLYFESIYVIDLLITIAVGCHHIEKTYFPIILRTVTTERLLIFITSRICVLLILYFLLVRKDILYICVENRKIFLAILVIEYLTLYQCDLVFTGYMGEKKSIALKNVYIFLIIYICVFSAMIIMYVIEKSGYERKMLEERARLLKQNSKRTLEWNRERDLLIHDIKNHIFVLEEIIKAKDIKRAQEYIDGLRESGLEGKYIVRTGNIVINALLGEKGGQAKEKGIHFTVASDDMGGSFVEDQAWCVILSNLVDNAIEACQKLENEKFISITLENTPYGINIIVENNYKELMVNKEGELITTKKDKSDHGFGYQSVRRAIEKYKGTLKYTYTEEVFSINIVLYR